MQGFLHLKARIPGFLQLEEDHITNMSLAWNMHNNATFFLFLYFLFITERTFSNASSGLATGARFLVKKLYA